MSFKLRGREFNFAGIEIRMPGPDGLTDTERIPINKLSRKLGYDSVEDLAQKNGYDNPREMAYGHSFKNCRDFFLGKGWANRLEQYNRNGLKKVNESDLQAIDPDYKNKCEEKERLLRSRFEKVDE